MTEHERRLFAAWVDEGANPTYHRGARRRLRREWPVLAQALDNLVREELARRK